MKNLLFIMIPILLVALIGCGEKAEQSRTIEKTQVIFPDKRIELWNGKDFNGFTFFLEDSSVDPSTVWMIKDNVIHCTGVPAGYFYTNKDYGNYKLHVEWRWAAEPGNSGVLLHKQDPDAVWPKCIEAQLKSGNAGDFYLMGGTTINEQIDKSSRLVQKKQESSELAAGEWNTYNITCRGDSIIVMVNGILQNVGSGASVTSGKICLQSEGKPIEFRNFYLDPLN